VRTAAIDALVEHVETEGPDPEVTTGLEKVAASDPDAAVRLRCVAALRKCSE
jgi:HEAT repeat protein